MKVTVLSDNLGRGELKGEWGLSLYIEYNGKRYLLDAGQSSLFVENAMKLGIDLSEVDKVVISHAHYDHTIGLVPFLRMNDRAEVILSPNAAENCYAGWRFISKYIGMPKGVVAAFPDRFVRPSGVAQIDEGVYIVPHTACGLGKIGSRNHLYVKRGCRYVPDDFSHEQTLVFKTDSGLVIFNSCSHSGPDIVVMEVMDAFPGEYISAYLGGLHLFRLSTSEVLSLASRFEECHIQRIHTGHCTGDKAFVILKERFGDNISQFHCGMTIFI